MMQISGLSVIGSLIGAPEFSNGSTESKSPGNKLKIIVAGAHPDDPESACGGTMALFAAQGHEVVSAYLTRGETGIPGKSKEETARIRSEEALQACKILNARAEFLGQINGSCEITKDRYAETCNFFRRENPDIVFTHWPIDTHPDHRICSVLTYDAWLSLGKKFALYWFEVESGMQTQNFSPSNYMDISSVIKQKSAACWAHASQKPENWYEDIHAKMQKFRGLECGCEYAEAFVRHHQNPATSILQ